MPLTYLEQDDICSVYRDDNGDEVFLAHGPGFRRLVAFDALDLGQLWEEYLSNHGFSRYGAHWTVRAAYQSLLAAATYEPDEVSDRLAWCTDCAVPLDTDEDVVLYLGSSYACPDCRDSYTPCEDCGSYVQDATTTKNGDEVCSSCLDRNWSECADCSEYVRDSRITTALNDDGVCRTCLESGWSYCEGCGGYYINGDADEHDHADDDDDDEDGSTCCFSPEQSFVVRNDGQEPLANDTRVTVTLPAGIISAEGLKEIRDYIFRAGYCVEDMARRNKLHSLAYRIEEIGSSWQTKDGNYTKRLSRFAYNELHCKIPPEMLSAIGTIGNNHATAVDFQLEVTRDLNRSSSDFGNSGSCWWGSYSSGRCALKTNGGFGLLTYSGGYVSGRAWVMPLKSVDGSLKPTFETLAPSAFVVFNGYGALSMYAPARLLAHMAGWTYRRIAFNCVPMYVNSEVGYLIAPEEIATKYTDGALHLTVDRHSHLHSTETAEKEMSDVA